MDIRSFNQELQPAQRQEFVNLAGTNLAYLSQVANGHRKASSDLARRMVEASQQLFPDDQGRWLVLSGIRPDIWQPNEAA